MPPGDVGNATSYSFPVLMRKINNLEDSPVPPLKKADGSYIDEVQICIDAAVGLEQNGVRAIGG